MATILIVDDQPDNLYVLQRLLKGHGYDVLQAENGATALKIATERLPDLILLDVMMPEMDGFEVVQRLRDNAQTRNLPVVLLTANAPDERLKIQGLKLGADEYLTQPINNNELLARVQALLRTKQTQDELLLRNTQLAALLDIVQASTSTLELEEVGRRLVERALSAAHMDVGGIWLLEDDTLMCLAQQGYSADVQEERQRISLAESRVSREAMSRREPIFGATKDLYGTKSSIAHDAETIIVLPLLHRAEALGVLYLGTRQQRTFSADDLTFLSAIANAAATAVRNARLFKQTDEQRQQLKQADVEKDEFISIISHELKNPLASIKGYAGLLQRRAKKENLPASSVKGLEVIEQQVNRMNQLLEQLRDVSQIGMDRFEIDPTLLDIADLTQRIALELQATTTEHQLQLELQTSDEPLLIGADEFRVSQVLTNLIGNAIKYSPQGGPIDITVRSANQAPCPAQAEAAQWAIVTVRDQGIGIPKNEQERLFQRFYRAPNAKGRISGMGLGLYITREIVERHGGCMWLESEEGQGSMFGIALPCAADTAQASAAAEASAETSTPVAPVAEAAS